jgi:hypothetical protein
MSEAVGWFVGLGTDLVSLALWVAAMIYVRRHHGGSWRTLATWALGVLIVAQLLDLPLAWLSRSVWTRADDTVVSLSVKLSAAAAVLETIGLAALVAAVFRGRQLPAIPRKGREIQ